MFEEVRIRERKSVKYGKTYEYRFEIAPIGGERKWLSKGGFLSEEEAKEAGIEAWKRYCLCGLSERPSDISYADFLDEWMEKECNSFLTIGREVIIIHLLRVGASSVPRGSPGVAQLVARLVRDQEAVGSNPATRTMSP